MSRAAPRSKQTLRFARFVVRRRRAIASLLAAASLFFAYPSVNALLTLAGRALPGPALRIGANARDLFPDHPFVRVQDKFANAFGNSSLVAIAVVVEEGTIFTPETLAKIKRVTDSLDGHDYDAQLAAREDFRRELEATGSLATPEIRAELDRRYPPYPVNHDQVRSITHRTTRVVERDANGNIRTEVLMPELPATQAEADELRAKVLGEAPDQLGFSVSLDQKAALVTASFVTHRLDGPAVYGAVFDHLTSIVEREQNANHGLYMAGMPVVTGWVLSHAWEIGASMVGAVLLIFLLLWAYFRRWHGVLIPLIAASVTVIWGLGFIGWMRITLDPLVLVIPMIITARAVSHTVQMAERFFEDFERLAPQFQDPEDAKIEAATVAMAELIVPGTLGILTDIAGLLVILVTTIPQMRNLGLFGAFWVASIFFTVEILHPILICSLPAPVDRHHFTPVLMNRFAHGAGWLTTHRTGKWVVVGATMMLFCAALFITLRYSRIGDPGPGVSLFWPDHPVNVSAREITEKFGGFDTLIVYGETDRKDAVGEQAFLYKLEGLERELEARSGASGALSLVLLVRTVQQFFENGDPKHAYIPTGSRQLVFLLKFNSAPGALGPILTMDGRATASTIRYADHRGETIDRAVEVAQRFIAENPIGEISIRLDRNRAAEDDGPLDRERIADFVYYMIGPLLPPRAHTLDVQHRTSSGYETLPTSRAGKAALPWWMGAFRQAAQDRYTTEVEALEPEARSPWPDRLAAWTLDDVDQWWDSPEFGIRAVAVHTQDLLVQDLRSRKDPAPVYQVTQAWTRGAHFEMAGGVIGILAAVNEEVERGHLANISLIFLVIFVLHSLTYRSLPSGAIVLLQVSTATLFSLAYMALRGFGLNINTLPVQAVGVGIGVDYAIYIVDRIRQEAAGTDDLDEAIRRAIATTGMAVTFTATTVVGGILFWIFSSLRFQAEMAQLLAVLMIVNMLGAIIVVPAFYAVLRPRLATSRLAEKRPPSDSNRTNRIGR